MDERIKEEIAEIDKKIKEENEKCKKYLIVFITLVFINVIVFWGIIAMHIAAESVNHKPIIYLYPEQQEEISVELKYDDLITTSYPKYEDKWKVLAKENGDLIDLKTNKELYSLYYESLDKIHFKVEKDGFIVKGEDTAEFLEEKLEVLGLNYKEKEEFIVYWLPKLEKNKYNYIRFASMEEINKNMPIEIKPTPDNLIRVLMTYKGLEKPIEVEEQKLESPERKGYVAVEWGGTEIK